MGQLMKTLIIRGIRLEIKLWDLRNLRSRRKRHSLRLSVVIFLLIVVQTMMKKQLYSKSALKKKRNSK
jgi:hypothetical protein